MKFSPIFKTAFWTIKSFADFLFFEDIKIEIDSGVLKIVVKEFPVINQLIVVGEPSKKIAKEIKKVMSLKEKDSFVESFLSQ